jgi:hypothetical protein
VVLQCTLYACYNAPPLLVLHCPPQQIAATNIGHTGADEDGPRHEPKMGEADECPARRLTNEANYCSVLFCKFYIRWRPIKASDDELVGESVVMMQVGTSKDSSCAMVEVWLSTQVGGN